MRLRSRAGGKSAKSQRRKTPKRRNAPSALHDTAACNETEVARLSRELREAREQQAATAEVLSVISASPNELDQVLDSLVRSAVRFCGADDAAIHRLDGRYLRVAAHYGPVPYYGIGHAILVRGTVNGRAVLERTPVHVADLQVETEEFPEGSKGAQEMGFRTTLSVPLLREGVALGTINLRRVEAKPFTNKQIALLQTFAVQAVIAIENARLLNELRQRTDDLTESLEQQTATSEILASISGSMTNAKPVFDAIVRNLLRLFGTRFAVVQLLHDGMVHIPALDGEPGFERLANRYPRPLDDTTAGGRAMLSKQVVHWAPVLGNPATPTATVQAAQDRGFNSVIAAPMVRERTVIGAIVTAGRDATPFDDRAVALIKSFADQAVIAIENARLFEAEQERSRELSESLEQQTATSKVLEVISSSSGDLKSVFEAILENAVRLCGAKFGNLYFREGDVFRVAAMHNATPAYAEHRVGVVQPSPSSTPTLWQAVQTKQPAQIADMTKLQAYVEGNPRLISAVSLGGYRGVLNVPMLLDDEVIGAITIFRQEAGAFADKQIELVTNFAKQAVIAVENTRLLNELRESLQQQTATADVLKVISRSTFDLQKVLDTLIESAARLCEADIVVIGRPKGEICYFEATYGLTPEFAEFAASHPTQIDRGTVSGRVLLDRQIVHVPDVQADPEYTYGRSEKTRSYRTVLGVPLLREGMPIGVIAVARKSVRPFTDKQIELVTTFADQAVIAIENVRLFEAEQQRTRELTESLGQQTATSEVLRVISSSPGELKPVFNAMLENAVRLCGAEFGNLWLAKDGGFQLAATHNLPPEYQDQVQRNVVLYPGPTLPIARAADTREPVHILDLRTDPSYFEREPIATVGAERGQVRTMVAVPMLKDRDVVGVFAILSQEVRPFADKQIELLKNFAAQAVIAIENTRLLNELRQSLEQQTATAEVLRVISSSPGDLAPVFHAMLENATRICEANPADPTGQSDPH